MASAVRAPRVYISCQIPAITNSTTGTIDASKLGSQYIITHPTGMRLRNVLEIGSDTADFTIDNTSGQYSPISPNVFSRYFYPGAIDNKYQIYVGLESEGTEEVFSKGTYVSSTTAQQSSEGANTLTLNCLDQFSTMMGNVYTQVPPKLYGNQQSANFNPNYALSNPSGDHKYYYCDAVNWMQTTTNNGMLNSDFIQVAVYSSAYQSGSTPVPNSGQFAYTVDYNNGGVVFTNAQGPNDVISVDARPQAINPMLALKHLFVDFASFSPSFLKLDNPGILIPVMEIARDRSILDVAKDICYATMPKGVQWTLYFDENGYLNFCEPNIDGPPVVTLIDERDILNISPEYTSANIANVVRAQAQLNNGSNNMPVVSVSYDVNSISVFGQKPTYDIPSQMLATLPMLDPGSAMSFMNNLTMNALIAMSTPRINISMDILPNPALQVGDPVQIIENKTGINKNFYIQQIDTDISESDYKQTLRLIQLQSNQDYQFGLQANIGAPSPSNPNVIQTQSGLISQVGFQNANDPTPTYVVANGIPAVDASYNPINFYWAGGSFNVIINLATPPSGESYYIWRWMYLSEDVYTGGQIVSGDGSARNIWGSNRSYLTAMNATYGAGTTSALAQPYDVVNNADSARSRRFYWPLLRPSDWVTNDGVTAYTTGQTLTSTWSAGPGAASGCYMYGNLRVGLNNTFFNTTSGFIGVQIYNSSYFTNTLGASSNISYGVDFGPTSSQSLYYGIHRKTTPGYLGILVATTAGTFQYKRVPFYLQP